MQQHHILGRLDHQKRAAASFSDMGREHNSDKLGLPLPSYPQPMAEMMSNTMTRQEWRLKRAEEDMIV
jgi:hypothetical protein